MKENVNHWIIYMYTFPSGKRYIGKTKRALSERQGYNFTGYDSCTVLWKAIQKYGIENIQQEILFENDMTDEYASRLEQICILLFKVNCNKFSNPKFGYNLTDGGDGLTGWHPDEERLKVLQAQMRELAEKRRGTHPSEETRKKQSQAKKGKPGHPMSEEQKIKLSLANSNATMSDKTRERRAKAYEEKKKPIIATNKQTGERIIFDSMQDVAKFFHVSSSTVTRWCNKLRNPSVNYDFDYLSANND
jgi:group I intron endonuclease